MKALVRGLAVALSVGAALAVVLLLRDGEGRLFELADTPTRGAVWEERDALLAEGEVVRDDAGRFPLGARAARALFVQLKNPRYVYEPHMLFVHEPGMRREFRLPEHPDGRWELRASSLGLHDDELLAGPVDLRVVVAGDSHVDGFCNASETFANVAERGLRSERPELRSEVLNAGMVGFNFYNYLGALERFVDLPPDVFVLTVYGGNDFHGCLLLSHYFDGTVPPEHDAAFQARSGAAREAAPYRFVQGPQQVHYMRHHPEARERAVAAAAATTEAVRARCEAAGIRLVAVYLPSVLEVQRRLYGPDVVPLLELLGLEEADVRRGVTELAERWMDGVRASGVELLDLRPVFAAEAEPLYWDVDFHLNVRGHRVVGEELLARLLAE